MKTRRRRLQYRCQHPWALSLTHWDAQHPSIVTAHCGGTPGKVTHQSHKTFRVETVRRRFAIIASWTSARYLVRVDITTSIEYLSVQNDFPKTWKPLTFPCNHEHISDAISPMHVRGVMCAASSCRGGDCVSPSPAETDRDVARCSGDPGTSRREERWRQEVPSLKHWHSTGYSCILFSINLREPVKK